jgi:catechol 2,3-dioxygenase-like lactoylglutathione lyase family enzyme
LITGAHVIVYSRRADADRAFFRDVLGLAGVDVGGGWLIFGLPPAEVAVHPAGLHGDDDDGGHELYLMCADVRRLVADLTARGVACTPIDELSWGALTRVTLPGGGRLGIYQPKHERPPGQAGEPVL